MSAEPEDLEDELSRRRWWQRIAPPQESKIVDLQPSPDARRIASVLAGGRRLDLGDERSRSQVKRKQRWQSDAWEVYDAVPEVKFTTMYIGNLIARVRLYPAWVTDEIKPPVPLDEEEVPLSDAEKATAREQLNRVENSESGLPGIMREYAQNWSIAGECYLVMLAPGTGPQRDPNEERWDLKSIDELVDYEGSIRSIEMPGQKPQDGERIDEGAGDYVARLWQQHPRFSAIADSNIMAVLDACEELQLLNQEARARSRSRMSAGILTMPEELSFSHPNDEAADSSTDTFDEDLQDIIITPISDEGHPSAVAPAVIRGPAELLKPDYVRWITFHRNDDGGIDARRESISKRIARGLPIPIETVLGHQETTFANAAQVSIDEYRAHVEPLILMLVYALTTGFYRPHLEANGIAPEKAKRLVVWYDPSEIVIPPDQSDVALKAYDDFAISWEALRKATNFTEDDAPDETELALRILLQRSQVDPALAADMIRSLLNVKVTSGQEINAPAPVAPPDGTNPQ